MAFDTVLAADGIWLLMTSPPAHCSASGRPRVSRRTLPRRILEAGACTAIRRRRYAIAVPGGLPVTARVEGDALTVLHTVVKDWACSSS